MKCIAINGSPRKHNNTAQLLQHALQGAASCGAETELIHLYDYTYKGCVSCFACKKKGGSSYGKCAKKDELTPVLDAMLHADAVILGSPVYLQSVTGEMRCFLERLLFPRGKYEAGFPSLFDKRIPAGLIFTMNVTAETLEQSAYQKTDMECVAMYINKLIGPCQVLNVYDTLQFDDYSQYVAPLFDEKKKRRIHEMQFPIDCRQAFALGASLIKYNG